MAISKSVQKDIPQYLQIIFGESDRTIPWCDYFHLGSELDLTANGGNVRRGIKSLFADKKSVYLMVGMPCSRKNHDFVLDAFDILWKEGLDVTLLIVGRVGKESSAILKRMKNNSEWNNRLILISNANDSELKYCYEHSKTLIFASREEGFGLPLIEALQHGLRVMASDIPIFHEVGGGFVSYFDLSKPRDLCRLVYKNEDTNSQCLSGEMTKWQWITPQESLQQLIDKILRNINFASTDA